MTYTEITQQCYLLYVLGCTNDKETGDKLYRATKTLEIINEILEQTGMSDCTKSKLIRIALCEFMKGWSKE